MVDQKKGETTDEESQNCNEDIVQKIALDEAVESKTKNTGR